MTNYHTDKIAAAKYLKACALCVKLRAHHAVLTNRLCANYSEVLYERIWEVSETLNRVAALANRLERARWVA